MTAKKTTWYKQDEIDALQAFINRLPNDTYLKPWLQQVQGQVVAEIRSDFPVSPSINEARKRCDELINAAKTESAEIVNRAREDAKRICAEASQRRDRTLAGIYDAIHEAQRALDA